MRRTNRLLQAGRDYEIRTNVSYAVSAACFSLRLASGWLGR
jgi:hypothetical protein